MQLFTHRFLGASWKMTTKKTIAIGLILSLIVACSAQIIVASPALAQDLSSKKIKIGFKGVPLSLALEQIGKTSNLRMAYALEQTAQFDNITIPEANRSVAQTLEMILTGTGLIFKEGAGGTILIYRDGPVNTPSAPSPAHGQIEKSEKEPLRALKIIEGKVQDDKGENLPGVSVLVKGTQLGTITDIDGKFSLDVSGDDAVLVFSFVGFLPQEVAVGNRTQLSVTLETDVRSLEELVVVGYGTQKKVNLTGAVTSVNAGDLVNMTASNLSNTLAGRAPGVNVTNTSGLAGATSRIRMRGSFGEPLFVIDGIVRDKQAFDALEAAEVDQMSFLKDAATAAIYGSRAGNGVVLVTTKKGGKSKPVFNFQSNYTTGQTTMPLLSDLTTATDELIYQNRVAEFNGTALPNGQTEFDYFRDRSYNVHDFIWRNPSNHRQSLSVSGGNDKISYYSLLSYRGEKGSYKSVDHGKVNLRSNVSAQITDDISLDLNIGASQLSLDRFYWPFTGDDDFDVSDLYRVTFNWPKTYPFYTEADGTPADYVTDYPVQTPMGSWLAWSVIDQVVGNRYIKTRQRQMNSILSVNFKLDKFIPGLSTKIAGSYIADDYMRKRFLTFQKNYVYNQADPEGNRFIPAPPDPTKTNTFTFSQNQPFLSYETRIDWGYQLNWFLNYNRNFGRHAIEALGVFEQAQSGGQTVNSRAENPLTSYDQMFVYPTDREMRATNAFERVEARQSYIGRLNYNFDSRYITEFSFRYDGNTLFPKHKRWGFFPSVSAAWRISEEAFFQQLTSKFDELKVRASYGTTGNDLNVSNQRIGAFAYDYRYVNSESYMFGDRLHPSIAPGATPNPNLTWATSTSYNAGIDAAFLGNRLTSSLDVFVRKEINILGSRLVTLPDNYGQALAPENYAARSWRGGEIQLEWRDKAFNGEVNYSINANMGYSKDRWDIFDEAPTFAPGGNRHFESRIGLPQDRIIGLKAIDIVRTQEQLDALLAENFTQFGRRPYLGGLYFEDVRGDGYAPGADGKIDGNDVQLLSTNAAPRYNYGFGLNLSYKGFSVQSHFQGVLRYDRIISNQEGAGMRQHGGAIRPYYPIWASPDVWTPENPNGKYPRPIGQNWYESGTNASSFWIRNGAYMRLRNLNVAYNIPKNWSDGIGLQSAQLFFNGTNLFAISKMKEFHDPEQLNYDSYPIMKTFTFGLDIRF